MQPESLAAFIREFSRLPGIGQKSAERLGYHLLSQPAGLIQNLISVMQNLQARTVTCSRCHGIGSEDPCFICSDTSRDAGILCVVEQPADVFTIEATGTFKGYYHVLGGVISPLDGVTPKDLQIESLIERISGAGEGVQELLFATSPTTEGDTTVLYIKELLKSHTVKMTHLARGIPVGTNLQFAGSGSLAEAIKSREKI